MPLRLFCWHPPRGGVECKAVAVAGLGGRVHRGPSIDQHYLFCIFVSLFAHDAHVARTRTYEQLQERPASRLSLRSSPTPTNQLGQLQATSHPPTSHIRCVPSAYPFHLQQRQHELRDTLPLLSLPVTCFPHVCQITAGFVSRPVSPCFVILSSSSLSHLSPDTTLQPYHGHPS
jgi:hypothetical protein